MKDFKDSYQQRRWERTLNAYKSAKLVLDLMGDNPVFDKNREYWEQRIKAYELEYPILRKNNAA